MQSIDNLIHRILDGESIENVLNEIIEYTIGTSLVSIVGSTPYMPPAPKGKIPRNKRGVHPVPQTAGGYPVGVFSRKYRNVK